MFDLFATHWIYSSAHLEHRRKFCGIYVYVKYGHLLVETQNMYKFKSRQYWYPAMITVILDVIIRTLVKKKQCPIDAGPRLNIRKDVFS